MGIRTGSFDGDDVTGHYLECLLKRRSRRRNRPTRDFAGMGSKGRPKAQTVSPHQAVKGAELAWTRGVGTTNKTDVPADDAGGVASQQHASREVTHLVCLLTPNQR